MSPPALSNAVSSALIQWPREPRDALGLALWDAAAIAAATGEIGRAHV